MATINFYQNIISTQNQLHILMQVINDMFFRYAVSLATSLDFKSPSDKMEKNKEIITHLEKAIELDPLEPMPYYIKGKWCWGMQDR